MTKFNYFGQNFCAAGNKLEALFKFQRNFEIYNKLKISDQAQI